MTGGKERKKAEKEAKEARKQAQAVQNELIRQQQEEEARQKAEEARQKAINEEDTNRRRRQAGLAETLLASGTEDSNLQGVTKRLLA